MFTVETVLKYGVRILIIFMVLPVHEFAHAFAARRLGDRTAENMGRLTLNPISHIDVFGAICLVLTGFGWAKPVPVNPNRFRHYKSGVVITSLAGPLSNLAVAYIGIVIYKILLYTVGSGSTSSDTTLYYLMFILYYFVMINVALAVFNILPIPPLDGSQVLMAFLPYKYKAWIGQYMMYINLVFIVIIFSGILDTPLTFLTNCALYAIDFLSGWIDILF